MTVRFCVLVPVAASHVDVSSQSESTQSTRQLVVCVNGPHSAPPLVGSVTIVRFCVLVPDEEQGEVSSHSDRKQSHMHEQLAASTREPEEIGVQPGALQEVVEQSTSMEFFSSVTET
jgi:hypothetical protein